MNDIPAPAPDSPLARRGEAIRTIALGYPEAFEEFPWGHSAFKVGKSKKVFLFLVVDTGGIRISMKLPESAFGALLLPFCEPTGYGLGKSGWVTATFGPDDNPPLAEIESWIDESFRAVATKTLVRQLEEGTAVVPAKPVLGSSARKRSSKKATKKSTKKASKKAGTQKPAAKNATKKAAAKKATRKAATKPTATRTTKAAAAKPAKGASKSPARKASVRKTAKPGRRQGKGSRSQAGSSEA